MKSGAANSLHITSRTDLARADVSGTLLQPDILLPAQYLGHRRQSALEPERALMLAILEDAVRCFQENHQARCGNAKRIFQDAQRWLFGSGDDWLFGFENICAILDFDPQYLRRGLCEWKQKQRSKERPTPFWKTPALAASATATPAPETCGTRHRQSNHPEATAAVR
jgi:hypothetical protein